MQEKDIFIKQRQARRGTFEVAPFLVEPADRRLKFMSHVALIVSLTNLVNVTSDLYENQIAPFIKQHGPYTLGSLAWDTEDMREQIDAAPIQALTLSDTLDGLLTTSGYTVYVDVQKVSQQLQENELIIATQTESLSTGEEVVTGQIFFGLPTDTASEDAYQFATDALFNSDIFLPAMSDANGVGSAQYLDQVLPNNYSPLNASGVIVHNNSDPLITLTTYTITPEGALVEIASQTATAEFNQNLACDESDVEIISEVMPSDDQYGIICAMFDEYGALLSPNYDVYLDVAESPYVTKDSVSYLSDSVLLTYPYIGESEVSKEDFTRTALHEILHAAYNDQLADKAFMEASFAAYESVYMATDYKMPTLDEQMQQIESVGEIEKVWGIITESSYIGEGSRDGHPWDNDTEMLSSTGAVIAFYPDEFVEKFHQLSDKQQDAIRETVRVLQTLIEKYDVSVDSIIPSFSSVAEQIDL